MATPLIIWQPEHVDNIVKVIPHACISTERLISIHWSLALWHKNRAFKVKATLRVTFGIECRSDQVLFLKLLHVFLWTTLSTRFESVSSIITFLAYFSEMCQNSINGKPQKVFPRKHTSLKLKAISPLKRFLTKLRKYLSVTLNVLKSFWRL